MTPNKDVRAGLWLSLLNPASYGANRDFGHKESLGYPQEEALCSNSIYGHIVTANTVRHDGK